MIKIFSAIILLTIFTVYAIYKRNNIKITWQNTVDGFKYMLKKIKELGFNGTIKVILKDMFLGRSFVQWIYLLVLGFTPLFIELYFNNGVSDWTGMIASLTGIICVILVGEGRASNYFFGLINSVIYLILSFQNMFYGELFTTLYFTLMQPIGLFVWLNKSRFKTKEQVLPVKNLDLKGWLKYLIITAIWWLSFGFIYQGIGSQRPFRDSVTDGTNGVGQLLMTELYAEQWFFWIATNVFSIYLWWGSNIQIQGMYWVYFLNSIVGWIQWQRQVKKA